MVKLGFIVEGDTEKILLESDGFKELLHELSIDYIPEIINATGVGNLLPERREEFAEILREKGATLILILADLDQDRCVTQTKERIRPDKDQICVISRKQVESWFLADVEALKNYLEAYIPGYPNPEDLDNPFEEIKRLRLEKQNRGIGDKKILARKVIRCGFSLKKAAEHPNCTSAKYFVDKLKNLSKE